MSIASEITRLQGVKADILQAISEKGVVVPVGSALDDCPDLIAAISSGINYKKTFEFGNYIVDAAGYIGEVLTPSYGKRTNISIVDASSDFSNSGLGQVIFVENGIVEIQGIAHNTVKAGSLIWLAENLKVEFTDIPVLTINDYPSTKGMWWMNDDKQTALTKRRGALYNWYAAKYIDDNKSTLLPAGWRMPTYDDWQYLGSLAGGTNSIAGRVLKSSSQMWQYGWNGDDLIGFFVQESGSIRQLGQYNNSEANYWTITSSGSDYRNFYFDSNDRLGTWPDPPERGYSLRLVKDVT